MSASVLEEPPIVTAELSDIFEKYIGDDSLPSPEWLTLLSLEKPRRNTRCLGETTRLIKRGVDVVGSLVLLIVLFPVMLLTAIAVWITSPGPVIFDQRRVGLNLREKVRDRRKPPPQGSPTGVERRQPGRDRRASKSYGKPFTIYKFRTMRNDAEKDGAQLAKKNDTRVTSIGGFLRKTRLDELPQLWNVLKGEMSLVGPRPERPEFMERLSGDVPNYLNRLGLKPGLTGLAQIINGYDTDNESIKRKVSLDLLYLQNCCFWNDLKILFRTISVVLRGSGAH
jgi:lipopolysaccharide/colanic/teichoic acid biosynthesis glycosyltransferase